MMLAGVARASPEAALQAQLELAAARSPATVGIYVEQMETHERAAVNALRPFPLASTFKLPLAVLVLDAVERKVLPPLETRVRVLERDLVPGVSPLYDGAPTGSEVSLLELVQLLLEPGDNSAANALIRMLGGTDRMRAAQETLSLQGFSVDRDETELMMASTGASLSRAAATPERIKAALAKLTPTQRDVALQRFRADSGDHGTPRAMAQVLARIVRGELLTPEHRALLLEELAKNGRGGNRIRGGLPAGTVVSDRTGTCAGPDGTHSLCVNDVGVVMLPQGGHLLVPVYVEDGGEETAVKEKVIANVARLAFGAYAAGKR